MISDPILYIEDEEDYQILVKRILGPTGVHVMTAGTGRLGLELLREHAPRLLILDINLPDADGYDICRRVRQQTAWRALPILMLTVRRRPEEWLLGFSSGASDYISKPFNPPDLIQRVTDGLEGKFPPPPAGASAEFQLIRAAAAGNRPAFEVLIHKNRARLVESLRHIVRYPAEAEDVAAQAFAAAFQRLASFRGQASFYTWLYRIAHREAMARQRRQMVSLEACVRDDDGPAVSCASEDPLHDRLAEQDLGRQVRGTLQRLPRRYRRLLEWFFHDKQSYGDMAHRLGIPIGTVMSRMFQARRLFEEAWTAKRAQKRAILRPETSHAAYAYAPPRRASRPKASHTSAPGE
jgi:RNA polymerase sigma-70 factor (ECF subfamily)